jgi:hypothetical protein
VRFNFPAVTFVAKNSLGEQIDHVLSEACEVGKAQDNDEIEMELMDLEHSLETFWRMLQKERGEEYVEALRLKVRTKNKERGYYGEK